MTQIIAGLILLIVVGFLVAMFLAGLLILISLILAPLGIFASFFKKNSKTS